MFQPNWITESNTVLSIMRAQIGPFCRREERNGDQTVDITYIVNPMQIGCEGILKDWA